MSDVDDELLALAGGDVSSDEDEQRSPKRTAPDDDDDDNAPMNISRSGSERLASRSGSPSKGNNDASSHSASRDADARKTSAKGSKRRANYDEDSEEEGEARSDIPSSPSSLQSAPMEESDSDSEAEVAPKKGRVGANNNDDEDEDENKYPVDGLFMTLDEKEEIMNMREVEREQILAERAQEKDRIHQNKLLRQLVSNDEQRKKRSASAADLDEGQRKTSRVRTKVGGTKVGETTSAMDTLKNRRAEKSERNRRREEDRERRKSHASPRGGGGDSDGLDDADGDSEVEWAKPSHKSHSPERKESQTPELRDVERVRLSRTRFSKVCFYPGFEKAITGSFVRIAIGPDPDTHLPVYRMAIVKGFTKGKPYAIVGEEGQSIVTDQYVQAAHGKAQREWPFLACSDSPFNESEWTRYQKVCHVDNVTIPKKGNFLNKADDINKLINRPWTEDELTEKVSRQQALKNQFNGVETMRLEYGIKEAKALGNYERAEQLQDELQHMEKPRLAFKTSLTPSKSNNSHSSGLSQQERLAQLNAENRRRNAEVVRKAQLKERARARDIERKLERGEDVEEDHSRRLKTRAKFVHDVHGQGDKKPGSQPSSQVASGASTPANGTPRLGAQKGSSTLLPHLAKLQQLTATTKGGLPTIHRPIEDDDIIASLDLGIDENIFDD